VGWELPECFAQLWHLLEARLSKGGKRRPCALPETFPLHEVTPARCLTQRVGPKAYSASRQVPVRHRDIKGLQNGTEYHHQPTLPSIFLTVAELEPVGVESVGQQMLPRGVTHGLARNRMSLH
jgi:hypothetical protein